MKKIIYVLLIGLAFVSCKSKSKDGTVADSVPAPVEEPQKPAEKIGLVLSGGGAKGAYEVGCWKAFEEYGVAENVKAMSGTSVGSLNAALFACNSASIAEYLWKNDVGFAAFLSPQGNSVEGLGTMISKSFEDGFSEEVNDAEGFFSSLGKSALNLLTEAGKGLVDYALGSGSAAGLCDRAPLKRIITNNVSLEKIRNSGIKVFCTAVSKKNLLAQYAMKQLADENCAERFLLNEQTDEDNVCDILLASSALPAVYESQTLKSTVIRDGHAIGKDAEYVDGGFEDVGGDNTPVFPLLYEKELDKIFVVYLNNAPVVKSYADSGKELINIIPSEDLGTMLTGTVNFGANQIDHLVSLGYKDACSVLEANGYEKATVKK